MRSLLFIPGDSPRKLEKGLGSGADALLLDLEDSISPERKVEARATTLAFLKEAQSAKTRPRLYVRVNGFATGLTDDDLELIDHHLGKVTRILFSMDDRRGVVQFGWIRY